MKIHLINSKAFVYLKIKLIFCLSESGGICIYNGILYVTILCSPIFHYYARYPLLNSYTTPQLNIIITSMGNLRLSALKHFCHQHLRRFIHISFFIAAMGNGQIGG